MLIHNKKSSSTWNLYRIWKIFRDIYLVEYNKTVQYNTYIYSIRDICCVLSCSCCVWMNGIKLFVSLCLFIHNLNRKILKRSNPRHDLVLFLIPLMVEEVSELCLTINFFLGGLIGNFWISFGNEIEYSYLKRLCAISLFLHSCHLLFIFLFTSFFLVPKRMWHFLTCFW